MTDSSGVARERLDTQTKRLDIGNSTFVYAYAQDENPSKETT
jgi:hypothetical protein